MQPPFSSLNLWFCVALLSATIYSGGDLMAAEPTRQPAPTYHFGHPRNAKGFNVWAVSPRAGLIFTDSEKVSVDVKVKEAPADTTITYVLKEVKGTWQKNGKLVLKKGKLRIPLPIKLPGRGLYELSLDARSRDAAARAKTKIAVVFTPRKPDPKSSWGIFYTPHIWFNKELPQAPRALAEGHRLLGASWSRLNFWAHSFGKVEIKKGTPPTISADYVNGLWKEYAKALRAEGITIMGEIAQCPRELSSRPNDEAVAGDAGNVYNRVKPKDWALWESLMEQTAAEFRNEIQVWEIWNEPDLPNRYWTGNVEDFAELVKRTGKALKRGNPKTRIAASGFTPHGHGFADQVFQHGIAKSIDILSVHYTDENPGAIKRWQDMAKKYGVSTILWNTEEKTEAPLHNLINGFAVNFKFIHVSIGYDEYRPLVDKDLTARPSAIWFSVGAYCIGAAKPVSQRTDLPGIQQVCYFKRGEETIAALRGAAGADGSVRLYGYGGGILSLRAKPLKANKPVTLTDRWGHSRALKLTEGRATVDLGDGLDIAGLYINGAKEIEVEGVKVLAKNQAIHIFEAEKGTCSDGWARSNKPGFSDGKVLELYAKQAPKKTGFWVKLKLKVPTKGTYDVIFAGNGRGRLKAPASLSPFEWRIDAGPWNKASSDLPKEQEVSGAPEGVSILGTQAFTPGEHTFELKLTGPRATPDQHYALWFDAVALRKK